MPQLVVGDRVKIYGPIESNLAFAYNVARCVSRSLRCQTSRWCPTLLSLGLVLSCSSCPTDFELGAFPFVALVERLGAWATARRWSPVRAPWPSL